jgi:hypothetical protein
MRFVDGASLAVLAAGPLTVAGLLQLPPETAKRLAAEGGPIETASAVLLAFACASCVREAVRTRAAAWASGSVAMLALLLRELDFHRLFTSKSIDSTGFYRSAAVPLHTKLLVVALALPFLVAAGHVLWSMRPHLAPALRGGRPWVGHAGLGLFMVLLSRLAEKTKLTHRQVLEEVAELMFAAFVVLAVMYARRRAGAVSATGDASPAPPPRRAPRASPTRSPGARARPGRSRSTR